MAAVKEVPVRTAVKQLTFGALIGKFCKEGDVGKATKAFIASEARNCPQDMQLSTDAFLSLLRACDSAPEVTSEARTLIHETKYDKGPAVLAPRT